MWENVDVHLRAEKAPRAREALAEGLRDLFKEAILSGRAAHPLLSRDGRAILEQLTLRAGALIEDPSRTGYVVQILRASSASIDGERADPGLVFLVNHAVQLLAPTYASEVEEAIQDAKFELGARASDVEGGGSQPWPVPGWELAATAEVIKAGFRVGAEADFRRIEPLQLADYDAPEDALPKLPPIDGIDSGMILYRCPSCDAPQGSSLAKAGDEARCACGVPFRVPIPGLVRMAAYLKAAREAASGISRCRACGAVVNIRRGGIMRAGFCSPACAREAQGFGEFVPRDGTPDAFACSCGAVLHAPPAAETVDCACGLKVWVPEPPASRPGRGQILTCRCGRNVKSTAKRCMYCGAAVGA